MSELDPMARLVLHAVRDGNQTFASIAHWSRLHCGLVDLESAPHLDLASALQRLHSDSHLDIVRAGTTGVPRWILAQGEPGLVDEPRALTSALKPRPTLVPAVAVLEVAQLMAEQEDDHGDRWRDHTAEHHLDAAWRHLLRHQAGEVLDPKSGRPHTVHATARMMMAVETGSPKIAEGSAPGS